MARASPRSTARRCASSKLPPLPSLRSMRPVMARSRTVSTLSQMRASSDRSLELAITPPPSLVNLPDQRMHMHLCGDVDAMRRLIEQQASARARQPFRQDDLLLVAARERTDRKSGRRGRISSSSIKSRTSRVAGCAIDPERGLLSRLTARQENIVAHREIHHEAERALARHEADIGGDGIGRLRRAVCRGHRRGGFACARSQFRTAGARSGRCRCRAGRRGRWSRLRAPSCGRARSAVSSISVLPGASRFARRCSCAILPVMSSIRSEMVKLPRARSATTLPSRNTVQRSARF